jgi:hypothetical protein
MKRFFYVLTALFVLISLGNQQLTACTVHIGSFRKTFRDSKRVFLGEIVALDKFKMEELSKQIREKHPDYKFLTKVTFNVERSWKGDRKKQVYLYSTMICDCPTRYDYFSIGKKYLVFSDKNTYFNPCDVYNAKVDSTSDASVKNEIRRLDSFQFRIWARIYPF